MIPDKPLKAVKLAAGERLGPYKILSWLGSGARGDVYRAKDTRLGRVVAIKLLRHAYRADSEELHRFAQEARAAGGLNHPNILVIYDIGVHDGSPYIVSELLEGETLRQRLSGVALSPRMALEYAVQMARALAAAHEKGIVHRDLKPENMMVTKDGALKILDFGLAKLTAPFRVEGEGSSTQSLLPDTDQGAIIGTVGYMSPEQIRALPVDHRSDIFAFGAILYEMLTGQRAFQDESAIETLDAILNETPRLSGINPDVPLTLERVVSRCLSKKPEERFQSARDLSFHLEGLTEIPTPGIPPRALPPARIGRRTVVVAVVALALLTALAGWVIGSNYFGKTPVLSFNRLTFRRGTIQSARFAPDGQTIIYGAAWEGKPVELFSTTPRGLESRPLGSTGAGILAVSSSGDLALSLSHHFIRGYVHSGTLARAPLAGGMPREILEDVQAADWFADGARLAVVRDVGGRNRLESPAGNVLYETGGWIGHPRISPKGDLIAFLDHSTPDDDSGSVVVLDLTGKKRTLSEGWLSIQGLAWSPTGDEIWFTATKAGNARKLHAVTLSGRERLVAQVAGGITLHDISRDRRVLLTRDNTRLGVVGLRPGETKDRDLSWLDWSLARDISSDGNSLLLTEAGEAGGADYGVYLREMEGTPAVRLGDGSALAFSPDGKWVLSIRINPNNQLVLLPTGAGDPIDLKGDGLNYQTGASWLPDGRRIVFTANEPGRGSRLYVQDVAKGKPYPITPEGVRLASSHSISSDGKLIVAVGSDKKVLLYPVEGGEARPLPGVVPGDIPIRWSADGASLFIFQPLMLPAKVYRLDLSTGQKRLWKELMPSDPTGIIGILRVLLTPDGRSYAYTYEYDLSDLYLAEALK